MKFYGITIALCMYLTATAQDLKELTLTFTESSTMRMGREWDFKYTALESPLTIVLKDNVIKGTLADGQVWGEFKVVKTKLVEEKGAQKCYNIFIEDEGELETLIYNVKTSPSREQELLFPLVVNGKVTSYIYYR